MLCFFARCCFNDARTDQCGTALVSLLFWEKVQLFQLLIYYLLIRHEFITELFFLSHDSLVSLSEGVFVKHSPLGFPLSIKLIIIYLLTTLKEKKESWGVSYYCLGVTVTLSQRHIISIRLFPYCAYIISLRHYDIYCERSHMDRSQYLSEVLLLAFSTSGRSQRSKFS